jgi:inosine-uridine nucleoside N-ribohydrolase
MVWGNINNCEIISKLKRPQGKIRLVLDTDAFNEVDDQYAITYALKKQNRISVESIYAVPFVNSRAATPKEGMELSEMEIKNVLSLLEREEMFNRIFKGSTGFLEDENTPRESDAAYDLVKRANALSENEILYVDAMGAITNIASALLIDPSIRDKIVVIWLGGHEHHWKDTKEFNLIQDVAATRVVFNSGVPIVQIPCNGVASHLIISESELREHMKSKSRIGDYLYQITCEINANSKTSCWSRTIWDLSTVMWLAGPKEAMSCHFTYSPVVSYEGYYSVNHERHFIKVVDWLDRDKIFDEFFTIISLSE